MLLSESRFLSLNHFIASVFLFLFFFCNRPQLQSSIQVMVKLRGIVEFIHTSCEQVFYLFLLCSPSQDDDRNRQYARSKCKGRFLTMFSFYTAMMKCRK